MHIPRSTFARKLCIIGLLLAGCNLPQDQSPPNEITVTEIAPLENPSPTEAPALPRTLKICLDHEPSSLFIYGDISQSAKLIRQVIYDGPFDRLSGELSAVLFEKVPSLADGDVYFEQVEIQPGEVIVNTWGNVVKLEEGVSYFPSGCQDFSCVQSFAGLEPVMLDRQVIRYTLIQGVSWSDGSVLSADDSVYSFEVAQSLFPIVAADSIPFTYSYQAIDANTIEWRSMPGFQSGDFQKFFFHPLPRHAWGDLPVETLLTDDRSSRAPVGWGPFVIETWSPGVEIVLQKNPDYFRNDEGLPKADQLIFRFIPSQDDALAALLADECDVISPSFGFETRLEELRTLEQAGEIRLDIFEDNEWEHLDFGILSLNTDLPALFQNKVTRQAIAMCIDRQAIASEISMAETASVPNSFVAESHPFFHAGVRIYAFDPEAASGQLDSSGWVDLDANPATARTAQGVAGVEDGTNFEFVLLTTSHQDRQRVAQMVQENLSDCGILVDVETLPDEQLFLPGPEGVIFGRQFQASLYSWAVRDQSACQVFTTQEIPGDYPDFAKGWGGANLSGYSNVDYDQACILARRALPGTPEQVNHYAVLQAIFSEDLPAIPIFFRQSILVSKPDLDAELVDPVSGFTLQNIELLIQVEK